MMSPLSTCRIWLFHAVLMLTVITCQMFPEPHVWFSPMRFSSLLQSEVMNIVVLSRREVRLPSAESCWKQSNNLGSKHNYRVVVVAIISDLQEGLFISFLFFQKQHWSVIFSYAEWRISVTQKQSRLVLKSNWYEWAQTRWRIVRF